jgi:hypothetical protein
LLLAPRTAEAGARGAEEEKKKATYLPTYLFLRLFEIFRSDFRNYLYGVFGLLMQRNGQKRDIKNRWENTSDRKKVPFFSTFNFFGQKFFKVFDMDFPQKVYEVFLNSPC